MRRGAGRPRARKRGETRGARGGGGESGQAEGERGGTGRRSARRLPGSPATSTAYEISADPAARGRGPGKTPVEAALAEPGPYGPKRVPPAAEDAHGLCEGFGFRPPAEPGRLMALVPR